jgi:lipooligosaccharide transport system permease protein
MVVTLKRSWYVAESRLRNMYKWRTAIITTSVASPLLYLTAVGIGIGALIESGGTQTVDGVRYLTFLAPALLVTAAIQSTMDETIFPTMEGFKWTKSFYAMNSTPLTSHQIVNGLLIASVIRALFTSGIYFVVLVALGAMSWSAWPIIPMSCFAGVSFAVVLQAIITHVLSDDGFFAILQRFVMMPLFLFSGTYYPLETMPVGLQWIGWISPVWHATEVGRWISYDSPTAGTMLLLHYSYFALLLAGGLYWVYNRYRWRLEK